MSTIVFRHKFYLGHHVVTERYKTLVNRIYYRYMYLNLYCKCHTSCTCFPDGRHMIVKWMPIHGFMIRSSNVSTKYLVYRFYLQSVPLFHHFMNLSICVMIMIKSLVGCFPAIKRYIHSFSHAILSCHQQPNLRFKTLYHQE